MKISLIFPFYLEFSAIPCMNIQLPKLPSFHPLNFTQRCIHSHLVCNVNFWMKRLEFKMINQNLKPLLSTKRNQNVKTTWKIICSSTFKTVMFWGISLRTKTSKIKIRLHNKLLQLAWVGSLSWYIWWALMNEY